VQQHEGVWVKRDDLAVYPGGTGGKARACYEIAKVSTTGLVTAGARASPQVAIVAKTAAHFGLPCRVHVPSGEWTDQIKIADAAGATVVQHFPGHNSVIIARAKCDAADRRWTYIPFGMDCDKAVELTAGQTKNVPTGVKRVVVPVGSGVTLAGVMRGLWGRQDVSYVGICVGANPEGRLHRRAPLFWQNRTVLLNSGLPYGESAPRLTLGNIVLDPVYEAKCLPFLNTGDLFWIVGKRDNGLS